MEWQGVVLQGGAAGVLLLFLYGFRAGWWRTKQEVDAWEARTKRAEKLVDDLTPLVQEQAVQVKNMTASLAMILVELKSRDHGEPRP